MPEPSDAAKQVAREIQKAWQISIPNEPWLHPFAHLERYKIFRLEHAATIIDSALDAVRNETLAQLLDGVVTYDSVMRYLDPEEVDDFTVGAVIGRLRKLLRAFTSDPNFRDRIRAEVKAEDAEWLRTKAIQYREEGERWAQKALIAKPTQGSAQDALQELDMSDRDACFAKMAACEVAALEIEASSPDPDFKAKVENEAYERAGLLCDQIAIRYSAGTFNDCSREVAATKECAESCRALKSSGR